VQLDGEDMSRVDQLGKDWRVSVRFIFIASILKHLIDIQNGGGTVTKIFGWSAEQLGWN
jgi:hypothetical protein